MCRSQTKHKNLHTATSGCERLPKMAADANGRAGGGRWGHKSDGKGAQLGSLLGGAGGCWVEGEGGGVVSTKL